MATIADAVLREDYYTDLEMLDIPEIDCDLLMELLEEAEDPPETTDHDSVELLIQSLQAEICQEAGSTGDMEDILLDLHNCGSSTYQAEEEEWFEWPERNSRDCYMVEVGDLEGDSWFWYHNVETSVEQLQEPLW